MEEILREFRGADATVRWESVKFDGSPHRAANAIDLGTSDAGRWLLIEAGTPVARPNGEGYDHPCDAVALIPTEGLWTATWLVDWDPVLYVDVARHLHVGNDRVTTVDLDIDVVRRESHDVEVLDLDEFDHHRQQFGYPADLVTVVRRTAEELADALREHQSPFSTDPDVRGSGRR